MRLEYSGCPGKMASWKLHLPGTDFYIAHQAWKEYLRVNALSRLPRPDWTSHFSNKTSSSCRKPTPSWAQSMGLRLGHHRGLRNGLAMIRSYTINKWKMNERLLKMANFWLPRSSFVSVSKLPTVSATWVHPTLTMGKVPPTRQLKLHEALHNGVQVSLRTRVLNL